MRSKKNASPRQLAANRANAAKSTGPRTPEGKAVSSQNAVTHGILQVNPVLSTEKLEEFENFSKLLLLDYAPRSTNEEEMAKALIDIQWSQRRYRSMEHCHLELALQTKGITEGFGAVRNTALTTLAHKHLANNSTALQLVNRVLSRLSREYHRMMTLYLEIHGPLTPAQPETLKTQNEPNPETEHNNSDQTPAPTQSELLANLFQLIPAAKVLTMNSIHPHLVTQPTAEAHELTTENRQLTTGSSGTSH